jgi:hypothetical protein
MNSSGGSKCYRHERKMKNTMNYIHEKYNERGMVEASKQSKKVERKTGKRHG